MSFEDAQRLSQGLPPLQEYNISDEQVQDVLSHLDENDDDNVLNAYRDWKKNCAKETSPTATVFLLGDMGMLDYMESNLPWIMRVKTELPTRELRADGTEYPVKASFLQWGMLEEDEDEYQHFENAMEKIGIFSCRKIHQPCRRKDVCTELDKSHLEESDLVCIAGSGDLTTAWNRLEETAISEQIRWRYYDGAVLMATGSAVGLVGERVLPSLQKDRKYLNTVKTFNIVPYLLSHDSDHITEILKEQNWGHGLQIGAGSGLIFTRDGFYEPVRAWVKELQWKWEDEEIKECYFVPPPRGSGTIMAVKAYLEGGGSFEIKEEDREQALQDQLEEQKHQEAVQAEAISTERQEHSVQLKGEGNTLFKAGKLPEALELYHQAVQADPANQSVFLNMAQVHLKLEQPALALAAANTAVALEVGRSAKGWYRRALAHKLLGESASSFYDAAEAVKLEPANREAKALKQEMEDRMQQDKEEFYFSHSEEVSSAWEAIVAQDPQTLHVVTQAGADTSEDNCAVIHPRALWVWQEFFKTLKNLVHCKINIPIGVEGCRFLCEGLKQHANLYTLDLAHCGIRTAGAQVLANALAQNDSVVDLNLAANSLRDEGVSTLVRNGLCENTRLMDINLSANGIGAPGLTSLGHHLSSKAGANLVTVVLNENQLAGGAARQFATQLRENETLQVLSVAGCQIPADVVWRLVLVCASHPELTKLDLSGHALSGPMINRLKERTRSKKVQLLTGPYQALHPGAMY